LPAFLALDAVSARRNTLCCCSGERVLPHWICGRSGLTTTLVARSFLCDVLGRSAMLNRHSAHQPGRPSFPHPAGRAFVGGGGVAAGAGWWSMRQVTRPAGHEWPRPPAFRCPSHTVTVSTVEMLSPLGRSPISRTVLALNGVDQPSSPKLMSGIGLGRAGLGTQARPSSK